MRRKGRKGEDAKKKEELHRDKQRHLERKKNTNKRLR